MVSSFFSIDATSAVVGSRPAQGPATIESSASVGSTVAHGPATIDSLAGVGSTEETVVVSRRRITFKALAQYRGHRRDMKF